MMNSGTNELLQNLDMEMQLLKKKREVIEQQMMCSQRMQLQNEYNPGPSNVSYGHQYQTVRRPTKRQNITPWQNEPLTKIGRTASRGENSWYQPNQSSYPSKTSKQQYNQFHQYKNKQQNNKFVPTKVEKNKPNLRKISPIRPNQAPLINETRTVKKPNDDIFAKDILHPDKVPTEKMTGRLELALGMILKELRNEYWNMNVVKRFFDFNTTKRELKFTIRERLRDLLLGKPVPHHGTIHTMYRRQYPIESDAELINTIGQNHNVKDKFKKFYLVFNPTEQPQDFVEKNFKNIIANKLRDMFKEIEVIYKNKSEVEIMKCTAFNHTHIQKDPNEPRPSTEENEENKYNLDQPVDMNKPYKDMSTREKLYYIKKHVHETVNAHLPSLLSSCAADISNLLCDQESTKLLKGSLMTKINPKFKGMFLKKTKLNEAEGKPESATIKGKYYAKVSCHPLLPSRKEMQPFLNSFKPCAIKKPKNSDEIILVLFNTIEEREALLAANGTLLHDKYHLNIVPAEAAISTQQKADNKDDIKNIEPDNKDATPLAEQETVVKSESSDGKIDLTHDVDDKNDNEVTKANDEQTVAKTEESSKAGENNEEQASSDKIAEMSNKDIEIDNENLTHDADTEMSEVINPDNQDNDNKGPSNDKDSEINKTNVEQESSNNGDLKTSNEDNTANTSTDFGDVDLDQQIDDLLTSISRCNAETETDDNESKKDSQVDESKVDQTPTVELDDDNSKSNEELKINEDLNAEGDSAMVIDNAKETDENNHKVDTDENNPKVDTDENNPKVDTDENNSKGDTDENNSKVDTDENNPKVESDESKSGTPEKVNEDAKSKNESVGPVRASGRIATRRSSRFVTNN